MFFLKEWVKANFGVVRFGEEFISSDHIKLEMTILNGETKSHILASAKSTSGNSNCPWF